MKIRTLAIVTLFAFASMAYASATSHKHRHHHMAKMNATSGMTTGMARSGPSSPSLDGGGVDKSRPGGQGVSRKPTE